MEYKLNEVRPGTFEVVRSMPVVMGTFSDSEIAQKFMLFLKEEESDAQREREAVAANSDVEPKVPQGPSSTTQPEQADTANTSESSQNDVKPDAHRSPYAPVAKLPDEKPDTPVEISDEPWTMAELTSAFDMLSRGDSLKTVAARHGKCWKKLRSKWAFRKKTMGDQGSGALVPVTAPVQTPLEKVTTAVEELGAQENCRICKRHFTPTLDNLDLCARCSHEA